MPVTFGVDVRTASDLGALHMFISVRSVSSFLFTLSFIIGIIGCAQISDEMVGETAVAIIQSTATLPPTDTPQATLTPSPTSSPTPTVTETAVPTPTITPSPTASLQDISARTSQLIKVPRTDFSLSALDDPNVYDIAVSPDDKYLAVGSNQGLLIFDLATLELLVAVDEDGSAEYSIAWSPDGERLVVGSGSSVWFWNFETRTTEYLLSGHTVHMNHVTWSPNLPIAFSVANNGTMGGWSVDTGQPIAPVEQLGVRTVQFSPNGELISLNQGYQLFTLNLDTSVETEFAEEHTDLITSVSWNPGGYLFVSGSYDTSVRIWDVEGRDSIMVLTKHTDHVLDVAWSPDGEHIASSSADLTTLIWDAETGESIYRLRGHSESIRSLSWFHDSSHLVTGSADGTIRIWEIP